ncbi:MAG: HDOD domain-containing protein [Candidatus Hydrogenedentota bacterium]|nr:MAG: HDOD domain-containing protein [Candidatus Hydrogenedentota bacterium]
MSELKDPLKARQSRYDEVYEKVDRKIGKYKQDLLDQLPFNPLVLSKAFEEIQKGHANFKEWADLFEGDPGLQTRFFYEANALVKKRRKDEWTIKSLQEAMSVLGQFKTISVLEKVSSESVLESFKRLPWKEYDILYNESLYMAEMSRWLAPYYDVPEMSAYALGLLANIGHFVMAQLFKDQYLDGIVKNEDRVINGKFNLLESEREGFQGMTHTEVGYWFMKGLGFSNDFPIAAYWHENPKPDLLKSPKNQLVAVSNYVISYYVKEMLHNKLVVDTLEDDIVEQSEERVNDLKKEVKRYLVNKFGMKSNVVNQVLDNIKAEVLTHIKRRKEATDSLFEYRQYAAALHEIGENAEEVINTLLSSIDKSVAQFLPYPIAIDYMRLSEVQKNNFPNDALKIPAIATSILQNYTTIMHCTILGFLLYLDKQALIDYFLTRVKDSYLYMGMGKAVNTFTTMYEHITRQKPHELRYRLTIIENHYLKLRNQVYEACQIRAESKNMSSIHKVQRLIEIIDELLKDFALQEVEYIAVTDLDYFEELEAKNKPFRIGYVSWNGDRSLEARPRSIFYYPKGLPSGKQMLLLRDKKHKTMYRIPQFLIYRKPEDSLQSYYYHAENISILKNTKTITVFLKAYNAPEHIEKKKISFSLK